MSSDQAKPGVHVRDARPSDQPVIRALLQACGLPVADLDASEVRFVVASHEGRVVGVAGLEAHGEVALLRSLAVAPDMRSTGLGGRLVEAIETRARAMRASHVVLLTTTATRFFANRGYRVIQRSDAPAPVQASAEFRSLCPASAVCMRRVFLTSSP